ncbi:BglG family transcription antiterminator [Agromyces laixinhei]|uniref:BglG family transcription antiterminator n=1 Tax=Agromyces laixinhei TaxID=2585717 RepID=UPI0011165D3E|nr:PTS sugar transporter subunit IIA [Agromyces laixinhei]
MAETWERLVDTLAERADWATATELASQLGVTSRTIRNYAATANARGPVVESGPLGYRLDRAAWAAASSAPPSDTSPAARLSRLIRGLADAGDGLDVYEIAASFHVSESTTEADLGRVRARLTGSGLSLVRSGPRVRLHGPESAARRLLASLFHEEAARRGGLRDAFPELPAVREALTAELAAAGYALNAYALDDVLLHIAIAVDRVGGDHLLEAGVPRDPADRERTLGQLLDRVIRSQYGTAVDRTELAHLSRLLGTRAATRALGAADASSPPSSRSALVRAVVGRAADEYLVELDDDEFIERLALHVDSLVARSADRRPSRNPLTTSIKSAYPLIYDLSVYIAHELALVEGIIVDDDEIAYIAMHVGAYLDRHRLRADRVRVLIIAPAYHDVHLTLAERITTAFPDEIDLVGVVDTIEDPARATAELLVSVLEPTVPVEHFVRVAVFPTETDLDRLRAELGRIRSVRRRARLAAALSEYISPELFVRGLDGHDPESVIRLLGDRMIAAGVIDAAYVESTLERERLSSTAFTEHLAVPHAMTMSAARTAIAIAIDDRPIDWSGARVNVVALIAFSEAGRAGFQDVFDQFVEAFSEPANVDRLVTGATDYPGLLAELAGLMAR